MTNASGWRSSSLLAGGSGSGNWSLQVAARAETEAGLASLGERLGQPHSFNDSQKITQLVCHLS